MFTRRIFGFLCATPQFRLFFNTKRQQHIEELQGKVFELRTLYHQAEDPQSEIQYLNELQQIHDEIVADQKGICCEQLNDKLDLAAIQLKVNNKLDDDLQQEILQLNFSELYFRNILISNFDKDDAEFIRHKLRRNLYKIRLDISMYSGLSEATLIDYCEMFKESAVFIDHYCRKHDTEMFSNENLYIALGLYYRFLGLIDEKYDRIQEAIINYEKALSNLEQSRDIIQIGASNDEASNTAAKLQNIYSISANILKDLASILFYANGSVDDGRKYLTKAAEIYSQIYGTHSLEYVRLNCEIAFTYQHENLDLCVKLISDLYDSLESCKNEQALLHVSIVKFIVFADQDKDVEILYLKIQHMFVQQIIIFEEKLLFQYHLYAIQFVHQKISPKFSLHHAFSAIQAIQKFDELKRSMYLIDVIQQLENNPPQSQIHHILILNDCLKQLKNQQYRITIHTDRIEDSQFQIKLFKIEHWILKIQLILFKGLDIKIDDIQCQLQTFIDHFIRIPQMLFMLIQVLCEFSLYMNTLGFKDLSNYLIEQMVDISRLIQDQDVATNIRSQIEDLRIRLLNLQNEI